MLKRPVLSCLGPGLAPPIRGMTRRPPQAMLKPGAIGKAGVLRVRVRASLAAGVRMRSFRRGCTAVFAIACLLPFIIFLISMALAGTSPELDALFKRINELYVNGKYADAIAIARSAVELAEKNGAAKADYGDALDWLAMLYDAQGLYAEAEPLYKRSLDIREKTSTDRLEIAGSLNNLAIVYARQGRYPEAEPLFKRSRHLRLDLPTSMRGSLRSTVPSPRTSRSMRRSPVHSRWRLARCRPCSMLTRPCCCSSTHQKRRRRQKKASSGSSPEPTPAGCALT
jgi:tetratricopeptide repeat protein